ncbi:MAG: endonuclease/exonuclease/phosphatase family protein [Janthinobacterium sp.]|jgi:endonuclease/exonuclease/phosphatase family metal-dependent hydrolase
MKIASYNIMSGGFNSYNNSDNKPQRLNLIVKAVNNLDADFVSLIDTFRWDELFSVDELKSLFKYKHVYCINLEDDRLQKLGHNNGITILTNCDVDRFETVRLFNRNAIKTTLNSLENKINMYSVYLDDLSEDTRVKQVDSLIQSIDSTVPAVVMGDFNTFSIVDVPKVTQIVNIMMTANPTIHNKLMPLFQEMQKGMVIRLFEENDFKDTNVNLYTTAPSPLFTLKGIPPILRIDYILTRNLQNMNFKVYKDKFYDTVSDHYPISVEIM